MMVYRLCSKDEVDKILKTKSYDNVGTLGKVYIKEKGEVDLNTHSYEENKYYMHFFPEFDNLFYLPLEKDMYICYYDIPKEILDTSFGYGEYKDYFILSIPRKVLEYSMETSNLKYEYLEQIDHIKENIPVDEYFVDESLSDFLETLYTKEKSKTI